MPQPARIAVVTGATGGIGNAICARLAADGFSLACLDRREEDVQQQAAQFPAAIGVAADVRDSAAVQQAARRVRAELGEPWLLVNAAGVFSIQRITELDEAEWDQIIDTNLKGPYLTCREFLPAMIAAREGCIVNVASTAGLRGGRQRAAYCASKGGLVQLTRSLAIDHGPDGVRVNCVCPGLIDTTMADWIRHDEEALSRWAGSIPARRIGTAAEVADAVSFLASENARYLHGTVLAVDGGSTA
jgi:NAD(P)-dependent dehydrogenase (short-subunit alcohol dehydrogenase family)